MFRVIESPFATFTVVDARTVEVPAVPDVTVTVQLAVAAPPEKVQVLGPTNEPTLGETRNALAV